jgi:hypothetical protein
MTSQGFTVYTFQIRYDFSGLYTLDICLVWYGPMSVTYGDHTPILSLSTDREILVVTFFINSNMIVFAARFQISFMKSLWIKSSNQNQMDITNGRCYYRR